MIECPEGLPTNLSLEPVSDEFEPQQQRRAAARFVLLYLKERLTGLGGSWQRPSRADVERYPEFKKRWI
jgi:hypothetical protein